MAACTHASVARLAPTPTSAPDARPVAGFGPDERAWETIRLSVRAVPLAPDAPEMKGVGALTFRGGVEVASDDRRFGGLSDLFVDADGKLLAVSDQGDWFAGQLVLDADGALVGLANGRMSAMRGVDGRALTDKSEADAEDIARMADGRFAVSFERIHRVRIYDVDAKGPAAAADQELLLDGVDALTANDSLEAMAPFGDDLLIGAEGMDRGRPPFWITPPVPAQLPAPAGRAEVTRGYGLVSLDRLPDGDFLAMERFFAPLIGPRIVIRRVAQAGLRAAPAAWEVQTIAELNPPVGLDNFEGIAIVGAAGGAVRIYLVSDDNFSRTQRTLLYAFDLAGSPAGP